MMKQWAKREMQIERVIGSTAGLYGDLQGIVGKAVGEVSGLMCATEPTLLAQASSRD